MRQIANYFVPDEQKNISLEPKLKRLLRTLFDVFLESEVKESLRLRLARGTFGMVIVMMLSAGVGFVTLLFLGHFLGASGYGTYSYAMAWVTVLSVAATMGLDTLIVREVAACQAKEEWGLVRGLLQWANSTALLVSFTLTFLALLFGFWLMLHHPSQMILVSMVALTGLPILVLIRLKEAVLRGLRYVVAGQIPEGVVHSFVFLILLSGSLFFLKVKPTSAWAAWMQVMSYVTVLIFVTVQLHKRFPGPVIKGHTPLYNTNNWLKSALSLLIVSGLGVITSQTNTLLLGIMKGSEATGIYSIASRGAGVISFFLAAANVVLAPAMASLYALGEIPRLQRVLTIGSRVIFLLSFPVAVIFVVYGRTLLALIGGDFAAGNTALMILSCGNVVNVASGSVGLLLISTGNEQDVVIALLIGEGMNVLLNILLIPLYGIEGSALASCISTTFWNIFLVIKAKKKLGLDSTILGKMSWRYR